MGRLRRVLADAQAGAVRGIARGSYYPLPLQDQPGNCILRALVTVGVISKTLAEEYAAENPHHKGLLRKILSRNFRGSESELEPHVRGGYGIAPSTLVAHTVSSWIAGMTVMWS